ncbi:hypothetical protein SAMN05421736_11433 [Evansella caseinilytica]|uniref:Uncharacterized protein n=1 Tax=Evansella caseinilytica TaxID=1503961 RepID=A0A1H3TE28_9BACI|nr:DUF5696 domain-containing protein [Evansella caseinilytica]SDZ48197.1 hypothetical protein SAMN05421736_11433 [Evansella caseinilytica]
MKTVKLKTAVKLIAFLVIVIGGIYFIVTGDDPEIAGNLPNTPAVPEVTPDDDADSEGEETEAEEAQVIQEPVPEQVAVDDKAPENRAKIIAETQEEIDGHRFLTANEQYEMYVKEENLSVIIREKATGAVLYSTIDEPVQSNEEWTNVMQSSIVMEYLVGTNIVIYRADMYSGNPEKQVRYNDDGFEASIFYPELEIAFEVNVRLTDSGMVAEIPKASIQEGSDRYKVSGFYVYPFLGYSKLGDREGYMFIPDGSGALIHLKDNDGKYKQPYSKMVYGDNVGIDDPYVLSLFSGMDPFNDPENILAPVFGMVQTDSQIGYLGIIEEGQYSAKIEAYPSGAILPYNWITSKFIYRQVYNQPTSQDSGTMVVRQRNSNDFDIRLRYEFVSRDEATYFGLAEKYRSYLLNNDLVTKTGDEFNVRVDMFGSDVEKGLLFNKTVPMTTFGQASAIFHDLQGSGVEEILSIYKGWQSDGYYGGLPIRSFKPEAALGREMSLPGLLEESEANNIDLYLYHDALRINLEEQGNTRYKVMKKMNKRTYTEDVYGKVYSSLHYLNPKSSADIMESLKQDYLDNEVANIALAGIANELFSYSEGSREYDRITTKRYYEAIVSDYDNSFRLLLEQPFSYLWNDTDAIIDLPAKSSDYVFTDEDIPFIALTLKGIVPMYSEYVNFQANQVEFFLQLVEQGLNPSFLITYEDPSELLYTNSSHIYSSKYELYQETIADYYTALKEIHEQTKDVLIVNYERSGGVTKVTYENGTIVYVNYQENDAVIDGRTIGALSYKVVQDR